VATTHAVSLFAHLYTFVPDLIEQLPAEAHSHDEFYATLI
jgi:hypothetical protein